jgi:hypothetical protein
MSSYIKSKLVCGSCNKQLEVRANPGKEVIEVKPCEFCLDSVKKHYTENINPPIYKLWEDLPSDFGKTIF